MCSNYRPDARLLDWLAARMDERLPDETWPTGRAPVIRRTDTVAYGREALAAHFGLVPHWAREIAFGRRTYNARSETADSKPSFRDAWRHGRRCIVPADVFYEPCWETGKAVRHAIRRRDGRRMGIAGLWERNATLGDLHSFTMLTVSAQGHAVLGRMHRPDDEKRMVAILPDERWDEWLDAPVERTREFLSGYPADELQAEPAPLPPRSRR